MHIVSAWASEEGVALGVEIATDEKSNEITAIPQLLEQINLPDALVTIDAMGCQKDIVEQIVAGQGDFAIAVEDNQPKLKAAIETFFAEQIERDFDDLRYHTHETTDHAHGRIDERAYYLAKTPHDFKPADDWPEVKAIGYAIRYTQHPDGRETCKKHAITSAAATSAAKDSRKQYADTGVSSRCIGPWTLPFGKTIAEHVSEHWVTISAGCALAVTLLKRAIRSTIASEAKNAPL